MTTNGGFVLYDNPNNVNDQFSYTIIDSEGVTATGVVNIVAGQPQNIVGLVNNEDGSMTISFSGIPNFTYHVQRRRPISPCHSGRTSARTWPERTACGSSRIRTPQITQHGITARSIPDF